MSTDIDFSSMDGDQLWLREKPADAVAVGTLRATDAFAGCGGMSLGLDFAAAQCGFTISGLAIEIDPDIAAVYAANFPNVNTICAPVEHLVDGQCGQDLT